MLITDLVMRLVHMPKSFSLCVTTVMKVDVGHLVFVHNTNEG